MVAAHDLFLILGQSFLGNVALTKVVSEYLFGYLKCMGHVKMGTFGKSAHILVQFFVGPLMKCCHQTEKYAIKLDILLFLFSFFNVKHDLAA